jgi:hypothetical protein
LAIDKKNKTKKIEIMSATPEQQQAYLNQLRTQIQNQTMQEMMNKMSEKCFKVRFLIRLISVYSIIVSDM